MAPKVIGHCTLRDLSKTISHQVRKESHSEEVIIRRFYPAIPLSGPNRPDCGDDGLGPHRLWGCLLIAVTAVLFST
jgi:hypothetical protein